MRALVFPGQGIQKVGMMGNWADLPKFRAVVDEVSAVVGLDLFKLMSEGPDYDLVRADTAPLCIFAVSMGVLSLMGSYFKRTSYIAGHSVGEYSALVASGVMSLSDAAKVLLTRGRAMHSIARVQNGSMIALLGLSAAEVSCCGVPGDWSIANDNSDKQVVISGDRDAIEHVAKTLGCKFVKLNVEGAFHSPMMEPVAEQIREVMNSINVARPNIPIVFNVLGYEASDPAVIKKLLPKQVCSMVRWRETMSFLIASGVTEVYEVGGSVIKRIAERFSDRWSCFSICDGEDLKIWLAEE